MKEIMKEQGYQITGYSKYNGKQYEYWSQEKTTMQAKTVEDRAVDRLTKMYAGQQDKSWAFKKTTKEEIEKVKDFHQKMGFDEKKGVLASSIGRIKDTIRQEQIQKAEKYIQDKIEKNEHVSISRTEKDTGVSRAAAKEAIKNEMEKGNIESKTIKVKGNDRTIYVASQNQGMHMQQQQTIQHQTMQQQATGMAKTPSLGRGR